MLSRIFWIGLAGIALIAGIALQDGPGLIRWSSDDEPSSHRSLEEKVDRAIDRSFDHMQVVGDDGEEIEVPAKTKRALAEAVSRLVKAEADLAMARIGDDNVAEVRDAQARRDRAHADVERLKTEIEKLEQTANSDSDAMREQIQREVREDVRQTVKEAVGN